MTRQNSLAAAGIIPELEHCTFDSFETPTALLADAKGEVQAYAERFDRMCAEGRGL